VWTNCLITKHGFIREMTIAWVEHMVWGEWQGEESIQFVASLYVKQLKSNSM
jgi:hypothetical protein